MNNRNKRGKKRKKGGRRKPFSRRYERHLADTKLSTSFTVPFDVWASLYVTFTLDYERERMNGKKVGRVEYKRRERR